MYRIDKFGKVRGIVHAFSTRKEGDMSYITSASDLVSKRRERFLSSLGIRMSECVFIKTEHKGNVIIADRLKGMGMDEKYEICSSDGLITDKTGIYFFLLLADCLPVIIYSPEKKVIALVHAGWKELKAKVIENAIGIMIKKYKICSSELLVFIGPSIKRNSYYFEDLIQKNNRDWKNFIEKKNGGYFVDLLGFAESRLTLMGIKKENIVKSRVDTAKSKLFYSNYQSNKKGKKAGKFACVVGMVK